MGYPPQVRHLYGTRRGPAGSTLAAATIRSSRFALVLVGSGGALLAVFGLGSLLGAAPAWLSEQRSSLRAPAEPRSEMRPAEVPVAPESQVPVAPESRVPVAPESRVPVAPESRVPPSASRPFIRVRGARFYEGNRPFHFLGANVGVMHGETERRYAAATLRAAARDGVRVVRIWVLGEGPAQADAWHRQWHLFRAGPTGWLASAPEHLDRVLAEAGKLGLRVILTLANNWSDYGGVQQYLRWAGLGEGSAYGDMDRFYTDARTKAWYRAHLERLLGRTSSVNGLGYSEDPTILAWELFNESSVTPEGRAGRRAFLQAMARLVRSRAPRQLVAAGVTDYARAKSRDEWLAVCSLPEIDYCDGHLYPEESLRVQRPKDLLGVIDDRVQLAHHVARKPLVFGEYGFSARPAGEEWLGEDEAHWHEVFLGRVHLDGAAGALPWIYVPYALPERRYAIWTDRASSAPVRRVLRRWARRFAAGPPARTNPHLSAARGRRPLYPLEVEVTQAPLPTLGWREEAGTWALDLPVGAFTRARFEDVGVYRGAALGHAYGAGPGYFEYRIPASPVRLARLEAWLRVSSEFPGALAPRTGFSWVTVLLGGRIVGRFVAPPDDGLGRGLTLRITDEAALAALARGPTNLRFEVRRGAKSNGLCLYGPTGATPDPRVKGPVGPVGPVGPMRLTGQIAGGAAQPPRRP